MARIYQLLPLLCPECGGEMRLIAFITEPEPVHRILLHLGEPAIPPPISPARSPPVAAAFDWDQSSANDPDLGEPAPEFEFDQTVRVIRLLARNWGRPKPLCVTAGFGCVPAPLWAPSTPSIRASPHASLIFRLPIA